MLSKIEKLRQLNEKSRAKEREEARKRQRRGSEISKLSRSADTRKKILAGSWLLDAIEKLPELKAQMMRGLDKAWLVRDDDRQLFALPFLSDEEKQRRELAIGRAKRKKNSEADAAATRFDSSAEASASPAPVREIEAA